MNSSLVSGYSGSQQFIEIGLYVYRGESKLLMGSIIKKGENGSCTCRLGNLASW